MSDVRSLFSLPSTGRDAPLAVGCWRAAVDLSLCSFSLKMLYLGSGSGFEEREGVEEVRRGASNPPSPRCLQVFEMLLLVGKTARREAASPQAKGRPRAAYLGGRLYPPEGSVSLVATEAGSRWQGADPTESPRAGRGLPPTVAGADLTDCPWL